MPEFQARDLDVQLEYPEPEFVLLHLMVFPLRGTAMNIRGKSALPFP